MHRLISNKKKQKRNSKGVSGSSMSTKEKKKRKSATATTTTKKKLKKKRHLTCARTRIPEIDTVLCEARKARDHVATPISFLSLLLF